MGLYNDDLALSASRPKVFHRLARMHVHHRRLVRRMVTGKQPLRYRYAVTRAGHPRKLLGQHCTPSTGKSFRVHVQGHGL